MGLDDGAERSSLPDPIPFETEEEAAEREAQERAEFDEVGGYVCEAGVVVEAVPKDVTLKAMKDRFIAHKFLTGWEVRKQSIF